MTYSESFLGCSATVSVTRFDDVTSWVEGFPVPGSSSTFDIICNIQPIRGKQVIMLPESDRDTATYVIYSDEEIKIRDRIEIDGLIYSAKPQNQKWKHVDCMCTQHYRTILLKVENQAVVNTP